ncbi:hypothetical protein [Streptomyces pilosus]|uniref:Uncharacterized protein n=1 Tax=Streptomyces pilosus TaxID=28893 RepID=A0A918C6L1_9ACTN|nr:hypothetical protein [Streptomyces pilosus]GGR09304.1 hypothetical protein GCM10010280_66440 [Streptomyces pilosus]
MLRLRYTAENLNPNTKLCGKRSLLELLSPARPTDRSAPRHTGS